MLRFSLSSEPKKTSYKIPDKLDPLFKLEKHIRTQKLFKRPSNDKIKSLRPSILSSFSPKVKHSDILLENINSLCDSTRRNIFTARNGVVSLKLRMNENSKFNDNQFETADNAIINQCKEFVYERKHTLRSQQELLSIIKLERSVTKKLIGIS